LADRKTKRELVATNPDWFWYEELKYWIQRRHLENVQIRGTIAALLHNACYTNEQKRETLDLMIKYIDGAENQPQAWYDHKYKYYKGIAKENPQHTSPDYTKDPLFKMPETYDELIAAAEAEMTHEERMARFAPSKHPPRVTLMNY